MLYAVCRDLSAVPARYTVGQYVVDLASFEAVALPLLEDCLPPPPPVHSLQSPSEPTSPRGSTIQAARSITRPAPAVLVVDELGKMELFSARFEQSLRSLLDQSSPMSDQSQSQVGVRGSAGQECGVPQPLLLGTVMERRPGCPPLVEQLQSGRWPAVEIVRVTRENRDQLRTSLTAQLLALVQAKRSLHIH